MTLYCGFCGKSQHEVVKLIAAPKNSACICDECVWLSVEIIEGKLVWPELIDAAADNPPNLIQDCVAGVPDAG